MSAIEAREYAEAHDLLRSMVPPARLPSGTGRDQPDPEQHFELPLDQPLWNEDDDDNDQQEPTTLQSYLRGPTYQQRLIREENDWRALIQPLFIEFMIQQGNTRSWSDTMMWDKDWNAACACPGYHLKERTIDVYDLISQFCFHILFVPSP